MLNNRSAVIIRRSAAGLLCALAGLAGVVNPAAAQCDIYRLDVPDFDQRRGPAGNIPGLPNNGSMHCVPTCYADWIGYINNHGYPNLLGGVQDWQVGNYTPVTYLIDELAGLCLTNISKGTNMVVGAAGLQSYLDSHYSGQFIAATVTASGIYAPTTTDIYFAMADGQLATLGSSRWTLTPPSNGHPERYVKTTGGHAQVITRVYSACSATPTLYTRDPAGDENFDGASNLSVQSPFRNTVLPTQAVCALYASDSASTPVQRCMYRQNPAADFFAAINDVTLITPKCGLSANAQLGQLVFHRFPAADDFTIKPPHGHPTPGNTPIVAVKLHPQYLRAIVVGNTGGASPSECTIWKTRPNGSFEPLGTIANPVGGQSGCAFGRNGEFYIADGSTVRVFDVNSVPMQERGSFVIAGAAGGPAEISALTYDDSSDQLILVSAARGTIGSCAGASLGRAFGADYAEQALPSGVALSGHTSLAASPVDGSLFLSSESSANIHRLTKLVAGGYESQAMLLPAVQCCPRCLAVDHRGHISFVQGGLVHELTQNSATGQWEPVASVFAGTPVGDIFEANAARSSVDDLSTPENSGQTVPPPNETTSSFADCPADVNASNTLTVQDIFDFLALYFASSVNADFNHSGSISVQDIFAYLAEYFRGCN